MINFLKTLQLLCAIVGYIVVFFGEYIYVHYSVIKGLRIVIVGSMLCTFSIVIFAILGVIS